MNDFEYRILIPLQCTDIWDIQGALGEVIEIKEWLDQATAWQDNQYDVKILTSKRMLDVWIKDEKIAVMCALRWA